MSAATPAPARQRGRGKFICASKRNLWKRRSAARRRIWCARRHKFLLLAQMNLREQKELVETALSGSAPHLVRSTPGPALRIAQLATEGLESADTGAAS